MTLTPDFCWAQRKDKVFVTLSVPNVKADTAELKVTPEGRVYFKGVGGELGSQKEYELDIQLLHEVDAKEAKCGVSARDVHFVIPKSESGKWWPRLLREPGRNVHLSVDWNLWVDEDEEDEFDFGKHFGSRDMADLDFGADDEGDDEDDDDDALGGEDEDEKPGDEDALKSESGTVEPANKTAPAEGNGEVPTATEAQ
ncbi:hypothetical protein CDCA_CDCA08G2341 [Cyanidium caldarium]|uniref:CS domain-containing protein n=1 Tax=Cyanidium caldarium TaxID=2771 RepID=A0AAV9IVX7_CYACA|nr:hypothetical protein CDCA_CDCA08G2341 [Cyanidium caldarium]